MGEALNTSLFKKARNFTINGGTFGGSIVNHVRESTSELWMKALQANMVAGAFHNSGERRDPPRCYPGTRDVVNHEIMDWVRGSTRPEIERFLWIYGPAGTGKSSISQTIAEFCDKEASLASNFFFSRTAAGRNVDTHLIPTLACQLTVSIPEIEPYMEAAIASDRLIFSRTLTVQLDTLILKPYAQLMKSRSHSTKGRQYPHLIIIDGLDECGPAESQHNILSALSSTTTHCPSLIFIIASRPEATIRDMFNRDLHSHTRRIVLDDHYLPSKDIKIFVLSKFSDIKRTHPMAPCLPVDWPSCRDVDTIVQNTSGQFSYASTAMKFIESRNIPPTKSLDIVLSLLSPGNHTLFTDLDALYSTIFGFLDKETLQRALTVLALIFITSELGENVTMGVAEKFLRWSSGEVAMVLDGLHSIVDTPKPDSANRSRSLRLFHASLGDFLKDKSRSKELFIDVQAYRAKFARVPFDDFSVKAEGKYCSSTYRQGREKEKTRVYKGPFHWW